MPITSTIATKANQAVAHEQRASATGSSPGKMQLRRERSGRLRTILLFCVVLATFIVSAIPASALGASVDEEKLTKLKAAYLYNLLKFTHWPDHKFSDDSEPIRVVILGKTPVAKVFFHAVKDRTAQDRPIETKQLNYPASDTDKDASLSEEDEKALRDLHDNLRNCHMVFISKSLNGSCELLNNALGDSGVLLVSDMENFAQHGGMVGLSLNIDKRLGFVVNLDALEAGDLRLSSSLMKLAEVVQSSKSTSMIPIRPRIFVADCLNAVYAWRRREGGLCS